MSAEGGFISVSCKPESVRQDVECGRCGGFPSDGRGRRGWIPSLGYSGKEGVTFLFVHITEWQPWWRLNVGVVTEGPVGSLAPIITLAAAAAGLGCVGGPGQGKHDVPFTQSPAVDPLRNAGANA